MFDNLEKRISQSEFKKSNYTIFNFLEEDFYIKEIEQKDKKRYSIDDIEYCFVDLKDKESFLLRMYNSQAAKIIKECNDIFADDKKHTRLYILHDKGLLLVCRLK